MLDVNHAGMPEIDIKHVHYFLMLAKHGSISKAANALGLAQPSLSEHIARLEARLNTKLAIRGPRGITMTEAGHYLAREGSILVGAARTLTDDIRGIVNDLRGNVSIGLPPSLSHLLSIPLTETVRLEMPDVRLHISEGLSGHLMEWLEQEKIDLGFVYTAPPSAGFQAEPVMEEEMFLVAASDDIPVPADENGEYVIDAAQLGSLPLVMPSPPHTARLCIDQFAKANGVELNIVIELDSLPRILEMVNRASAYTILPHAAVAEMVNARKLTLVRIKNPTFLRTIYMIRTRARSISMISLRTEKIVLQIMNEMLDRYGLNARMLATGRENVAA
ncbi:MAG: LysR family transcriptional regulator [Amaricoccus sp.]|uniref:LysR family transcriptional regulator n=1 Tax=Amaricoccus sp. TaxID=1872485 RepID=UPI0039E60F32